MKRLSTFLMAFLGIMLFAPFASAQTKTAIGAIVDPDGFEDGMEVVFEARSGISSRGHYLHAGINPPIDATNNSWNWAKTIDDTKNVPDEFRFVLVKADESNSITGLDQWYIQSKSSGKYLTFKWRTWNGELSGTYISLYAAEEPWWVDDIAEAKAFCLINNDPSNSWKEQYGSNSYGSSSADWGPDTYTICHIFDPTGIDNWAHDGGSYGRVFLSNEFEVSHFNIRFYSQYQDTNVWDIRKIVDPNDPLSMLESYVDQLPTDIAERYVEGTDPGFVGDHAAYTEFFEAYNAALDGSITTEEEAKAGLTRLQNAYEAINKAIVKVKNGGYYYIKTAYDAFYTVENGEYAWIAPYNSTSVGWRAFKENDNRFIWQVTENPTPDSDDSDTSTKATGRMYYTFKNVGTNLYLGDAASHVDGQPVLFTKAPKAYISLIDNGAGQWGITSKTNYWDMYPPRPYHMNGHGSGGGSEGTLVIRAGERNTASSWFIREVPADQIAGIDDPSRKAIDSLTIALTSYAGITDGAEVGPEVGKPHSQEIVDNLNNALTAASGYAYGDVTGTIDEINAARKAIVDAGEAFKKEVNVVPDGYYRIRSNYANFHANENDAFFALYNDSLPGWKHYQNTTEQLWKITSVADGYTIQNMKNGMYLNKAAKSSNGSLIDMTAQPETSQLLSTIKPNGKWGIYNVADSTFGYDPAGHGNGAGETGRLQIWSPREENGGTSWTLIAVSDDDAQALIASEPQNELNVKLQAAYETGRALFNSKTDYTIGEPIIKAADQLYANNWSPSEGANIANMIDGDKNTYWNSTWEAGQEQDPDNPHYLRIYDEAGFPDSVQVQWVMRQDGTWHREAVKMRVQVSNDADSWTTLYELKRADVDGCGSINLAALHSDSIHYLVTGLKGYKFVRFLTLVNLHSNGDVYLANNHMMTEYAEYNLYPVTGINPASYSQLPAHKGVADDLFAALQEAQPQYMNGTATQATLDKLLAAVEAFGNLASNDSLMSMTSYNFANLTAGDRIGEFPQEALDAYKQTLQTYGGPLYEKINTNQPISGQEFNTACAKIREAYNELYKTMVRPEKDAWYLILAGDGSEGTAIAAGGSSTHLTSQDSYSYFLVNYQSADNASEQTGLSFTVNADENGRYVLQCVRNGGYFGPLTGSGDGKYDYHPIIWYTPKSFEIVPFGNGQIGFITPDGYYIKQKGGEEQVMDYTRDMNNYEGFQNSGYAWTLERTDANHADLTWNMYSNVAEHRVIALTVPYEIQNPAKWGTEDLNAYELVGKSTAEGADSIVTAYWLKKIDAATIGAGKPAIYITPGEVYNEESKDDIFFTPVLNTALKFDVDTVNGLRSTNANWNTTEAHLGYFLKDSVVDEPVNLQIGRQRGVIVPYLVENTISSIDEADAVVYVQGAGMLNGIETNKVIAVKMFVDVYTTDGVLIRKHVDAAKATDGLAKGVYVIGTKKVLVK